jgi:hypothetical protein
LTPQSGGDIIANLFMKSLLTELLPFPAVFWVPVDFSLVAARSMLTGFERLNREVQALLQSMSLHSILKKGKSSRVKSPLGAEVPHPGHFSWALL